MAIYEILCAKSLFHKIFRTYPPKNLNNKFEKDGSLCKYGINSNFQNAGFSYLWIGGHVGLPIGN